MKRALVCVFLVVASVFCLWYTLSGTNKPPPGPHGGRSASLGSAGAPNSINTRGAITPSSGGGAPKTASAGGGAVSANPLTNSPTTNSPPKLLSCNAHCQTSISLCQSACYRSYSVTNQTQDWGQCMQTCGTKLSICSNSCIAGTTVPTNSPTAMAPPSQQAVPPAAQSARTPSLQPEQSDNSSSSTSSGQ